MKVKVHLYFPKSTVESYIKIYEVLEENYKVIVNDIYGDVVNNVDKLYEIYEREAVSKFSHLFDPAYDDMGDLADNIREYALEKIEYKRLMYYQFVMSSICNLYQVFEQQLRKWLHHELTHSEQKDINQLDKLLYSNNPSDYHDFYGSFGGLNKLQNKLNLSSSTIWNAIKEVNLLSNTYKHGSGSSSKELLRMNPHLFNKVSGTMLVDLYLTTNQEEVIDIERIDFLSYLEITKKFWLGLEEHINGEIEIK